MDNPERLREICRLITLAVGITNKLEICVSKLRGGFLDDNDFYETQKTLERLSAETNTLYIETNDKLDKGDLK